MPYRRIQLFFFLGASLIALYFSIRFTSAAISYFALQAQSSPHIDQWEIVEINGLYALKAHYTFGAQEKNWHGTFTLNPPYYLNEPAAFSALKQKAKESWTVWYRSANPSISALQKKFPAGLLIRALICCGVAVYFCFLKRKISIET
ncbi:MAG: hypothetical protein WCF19_03180 [Chlamydiales bacterium]